MTDAQIREAACAAFDGATTVNGSLIRSIMLTELALVSLDAVYRAGMEASRVEARQWHPGSELPPRFKSTCESITVLAWAGTGDGCFQLTSAKVPHMTKGEWREVRFDHDGMGQKIVVRCWTEAPSFPRSFVGRAPTKGE